MPIAIALPPDWFPTTILTVVILGGGSLCVWVIIDCIKHDACSPNEKIFWIFMIIFLSWIGAILYILIPLWGRKRTNRSVAIPKPAHTQKDVINHG